jgi:deazaflavin-dependent oxidoreductase (nitroreductase family)
MEHNAWTRFIGWFGGRRWGAWVTRNIYTPVDRWLYRKTNGRRGLSPSKATLWLTTTGAKSGQPRGVPVLYLRDPDRFWLMASNYGGKKHPAWSANLLANPFATVTIGRERYRVRARLASDEEKGALWPRLIQVYPAWDEYTKWTDRSFRLFAMEVEGPG